MSRFFILGAFLFSLLAGSAIAQPTTAPAANATEVAAVRDAARQFMLNLDATDLEAARWMFAGNDEEFKLVEGLHAAIHAGAKVKHAMVKRFPNEMTEKEKKDDISADSMIERLDKEAVTIEGNVATIGPNGMRLKRDATGTWQVSELTIDPKGRTLMGTIMPVLAKVLNEFAGDLEKGRFSSKKEADAAISRKLRTELSKVIIPPASQPVR